MTDNKTDSTLIGFCRKTKAGGALKLSIDVAAMKAALKRRTYQTGDGRTFTNLVINLEMAKKVIAGEKEVTKISQLLDGEPEKA